MACSGDTTTGLDGQIKSWKNPSAANVGTLTIGGNDLGFSIMITWCVLTPYTWYPFGSSHSQRCLQAEDKARSLMADPGPDGLGYKLEERYKDILAKSARTDFHVYVPSYVGFFNHNTTDCDQSTFHYLWAGYKPPSDAPLGRIVYLTTDLRKELNELAISTHNVIHAAVDAVNSELGTTQVHYVDMQPRFDRHRRCEPGPWHEPNPYVPSTYSFLSEWPDVTSPSSGVFAVLIYSMAQDIARDPTGPPAQMLANANKAIADQNFSDTSVRWYLPTSQIKTIHPRTAGMALYRDAVIAAMLNIQGSL